MLHKTQRILRIIWKWRSYSRCSRCTVVPVIKTQWRVGARLDRTDREDCIIYWLRGWRSRICPQLRLGIQKSHKLPIQVRLLMPRKSIWFKRNKKTKTVWKPLDPEDQSKLTDRKRFRLIQKLSKVQLSRQNHKCPGKTTTAASNKRIIQRGLKPWEENKIAQTWTYRLF